MAQGTETLTYLSAPPSTPALVPEDCYYLVSLHEAEAFYAAGLFTAADSLACSTEVSVPKLHPGQTAQSLHKVAEFGKNTPWKLGLAVNLTDWLPARRTDTVQLTVKFNV